MRHLTPGFTVPPFETVSTRALWLLVPVSGKWGHALLAVFASTSAAWLI